MILQASQIAYGIEGSKTEDTVTVIGFAVLFILCVGVLVYEYRRLK